MVLYDYLTQNSQMVNSAAAGFQGAVPTLALQMAVVTITIIPVLIAYPFVQRHFTKGVLLGAVKG
jgi:ABC-type glycerol-3-phosphate transport system permease component